ncbi:class I SAM-dependent methyltransferase [Bacteroidota bacterium]
MKIDPHELINPDFWKEAWSCADEKKKESTGDEQGDEWKKLWDKQSKRYAMSFEPLLNERRMLVDFFLSQDIIKKGDSVFDIGCGTGSFAIPFLEKGCNVTALDSSGKMIEEMKASIKKMNLPKPECIVEKFQDYESDSKFDVVMAAFTPAVKSADLLFKMEKIAKKYCILLASYDQNMFAARYQLYEMVFKKPHNSIGYNAFFPLNLLYTAGRMPNLKIYETEEDKQNSLDEQIEYYLEYFKTLGKNDLETKEIVTNYFTERSVDGVVHNKFKKRTAVIWWSKFNDE